MIDYDNMAPNLQLVSTRFLNFLLRKLSREFKLHCMSILQEYVLLEATVTWLGMLMCMLM